MPAEVELSSIIGPADIDVAKPEPADQRLFSVTTIIGVLDKPALLYWSAEQAALAAVRIATSLPKRIEETGEAAVVKWLRDARNREVKGQRTAADLGTDVHAACEQYAITGTRPQVDGEVAPFVDRFEEWCEKYQPSYEAAEVTVYHPDYGYAGTLDAVLRVQGFRAVTDYKTSRKSVDAKGKPTGPYPTVALQLAAYRFAKIAAAWRPRRYEQFRRRYYLLGDAEIDQGIAVPEVDGGLCIHITPEHCVAYPVVCNEEIFERFLFILEAARFPLDISKRVIGPPLSI